MAEKLKKKISDPSPDRGKTHINVSSMGYISEKDREEMEPRNSETIIPPDLGAMIGEDGELYFPATDNTIALEDDGITVYGRMKGDELLTGKEYNVESKDKKEDKKKVEKQEER